MRRKILPIVAMMLMVCHAAYSQEPSITVEIKPEHMIVKNGQEFSVLLSSDNPDVHVEQVSCLRKENFVLRLKPGETYDRTLSVRVSPPADYDGTKPLKETFRLGFFSSGIPMQNVGTWSNAITVGVVAADEPLHLEVTEHTDVAHEFTGTAKSYGVTIINTTDSAVTIEGLVGVETEMLSGWVVQASIDAVANCRDFYNRYNSKAPVHLDAHGALAVVSWNGFMCGGQCVESCTQNIRLRPGFYRFLVVIVPTGQRVASPPFTLPPL